MRRTRRVRVRRGVTILEVVFAAVIIALSATAVSGTISFVINMSRRSIVEIGAWEVANRLMLQYLDDPVNFPPATLGNRPIAYGEYLYRWELTIKRARKQANRSMQAQSSDTSGVLGAERFEYITVSIWLADETDPSGRAPASDLLATLTRVADPIYPRNPEAIEKLLSEGGMTRLINALNGREAEYGPGHETSSISEMLENEESGDNGG